MLASFGALATEEHYIFCNDCSAEEKSQAADSWVMRNVPDEHADEFIPVIVHVMDLTHDNVESWLAYKRKNDNGWNWYYFSQKLPHETPVEVVDSLNELSKAKQELLQASMKIVVPNDIISDPWEFVGCAYCKSRVENYFNKTLGGQIENYSQFFINLTIAAGVNHLDHQFTFKIQLENGGSISFKGQLAANSLDMIISEIIEVFDESGNSVPLTEAQAKNLAIYVPNIQRASDISHYLHTIGMGIELTEGRVTVRECTGEEHDDCYN